MTPEQGYHLAQFQHPGVKIVMGPTEAREERIASRGYGPYARAFGDAANGLPTPVADTADSWFELDCARLIGKTRLSFWTMNFLYLVSAARKGALPTAEEVAFFAAKETSLSAAQTRLDQIVRGAQP